MSEIEPCPFCGGKIMHFGTHEYHEAGYMQCAKCDATGPEIRLSGSEESSEQEAIVAWNKRDNEKLRKQNEALREVYEAAKADMKKADLGSHDFCFDGTYDALQAIKQAERVINYE